MSNYFISSNKYSLRERQTKRGKVYDVVFRVITKDGKEIQKNLCGYHTKALAKQGYLDFTEKECEVFKKSLLKKVSTDKEDLFFEDLVEPYFLSLKNQIKDSSLYDKKNIFRLVLLPYFKNKKIKDLTKDVLYIWQDELWSSKNPKTNDYYSYKYLSKIRTQLSAFLSWCSDRYNYPNYLLQVTKPKRRTQKKQMQIWTREEFDKFISVVDNPLYHTFFMVLFFTGRRKGEVLALSKEDVKDDRIIFNKSLTRKTLTSEAYQITSTKTEKIGATPICNTLQQELKTYNGGDRFYFGGDKPLAENTIRRYFNEWCKIAEVKQIRIHDLRHSFVSMLLHLGANFLVVADLIGDTVEQITKTYAHLYEDDKGKIIAKLG